MPKSPIVLPLSTTFLQRFSQHFSTDGGRKPIGWRTETDWTADANGGTLRGCTCLKCTNVLYYGEMMRRVTYVNTTTSYNTLVH